MVKEVWKPIKGWDGIAEISNLGRVKVLARSANFIKNGKPQKCFLGEKIVSPYVAKNGYLTIAFMVNKVRKKVLVHRAVSHAFVEGYFEGATVNHIDGNKLNNTPENLEWMSSSDNSKHEWAIGLVDLRGEKHPSHKLTAKQVRIIRKLLRSQITNPNELSELLNVSAAILYLIQNGKRWSSLKDEAGC